MTFIKQQELSAARIAQLITLVVGLALVLGLASPALAQDGTGLAEAISGIVKVVTDIIQSICIGLGILGLSIWGLGKLARPIFPQLAGLTQNYISDLMIGLAVVFIASSIVEGVASAMQGAGG